MLIFHRVLTSFYVGTRNPTFSEAVCNSADEVLCENRQICIKSGYVCDDMSDCPWGTDEQSCSETGLIKL